MRYTSLIIATGFCLLTLGCQAKKDLENCQVERTQVKENLTLALSKNKELTQNIILLGSMLDKSMQEMNKEKTTLHAKISQLENQLEEAGRHAKEHQVQMGEMLKTLSVETEAKIKKLQARLGEVQATLDTAESDNKQLKDQLSELASHQETSDTKAENVE